MFFIVPLMNCSLVLPVRLMRAVMVFPETLKDLDTKQKK